METLCSLESEKQRLQHAEKCKYRTETYMMTSSNRKIFHVTGLCAGNSPVTGGFPSQRPLTRPLMFSLICAWTNIWANSRDAGDLRRHRFHYDVTVMQLTDPGKFMLTHGGLVTPNGIYIWINIGSGNDGTKPLPEAMSIIHQWDLVAFTWGHFQRKFSKYVSLIWVLNIIPL